MLTPDIVLLGPEWPIRALLRAQLLEEGYEVIATDAWPIPLQFLGPGFTPRAMIIDLHGLAEPRRVLDELRMLFNPDHVLVLTALGTLSADDIRRLGFHVLARPASVADIVARAKELHRGGRELRG
jgi:DNA-binding response OmpR family regulator